MGRGQTVQTHISRLIKGFYLFAYWWFYQKASFLRSVVKQCRHRSVVWSRGLNCLLIECSINKRPFCGTWANSADTDQSSDKGVSTICLLNVLSKASFLLGVGKQHRHRSVVWSRGLNCLLIECSILKRPFLWGEGKQCWPRSVVSTVFLLNFLSKT